MEAAVCHGVAAGPAVNVLICVVKCGRHHRVRLRSELRPVHGAVPQRTDQLPPEPHREQPLRIAHLCQQESADKPADLDKKIEDYKANHKLKHSPNLSDQEAYQKYVTEMGFDWGRLPSWVVWSAANYGLNWLMLLFNLLPAYPLDGGQLLQSLVWARTDHRRGVVVAAYAGFTVAVIFSVASIAVNEAVPRPKRCSCFTPRR